MRAKKVSWVSSLGRAISLSFCIVALSVCVSAETGGATISYTQDFPGSDPAHYAITIHADGSGNYESNGRLSPQGSPGELTSLNFTISPETCKRMFELAKKAHYFQGRINSNNPKIASTGTKVLSYQNGEKKTKATYNFSPVPAVEDLTDLFQGLSTTLEFGRRLTFERRYEKLALADEIRSLMDMSQSGQSLEIEAIAPVLQQIVDDHTVLTFVRARAQLLLQDSKTASLKK